MILIFSKLKIKLTKSFNIKKFYIFYFILEDNIKASKKQDQHLNE